MDQPWLREIRHRLAERKVDLEPLLQRVVDEATHVLQADRGTLYLVDQARGELVSRVAHLPELSEIRLRIGEGVAGQVAATGDLVNSHGGTPRSDRFDELTGYNTRTLLAAPVHSESGTIIGVLQVLNKRRGRFNGYDEELIGKLSDAIGEVLELSSLGSQLQEGHSHALAFRFNGIVGGSDEMQAVFDRASRAARTDATVLIRGESGSGKELVAKAVHDNSERADRPFVVVDLAALPQDLIENELFGHEKGAFTGAERAELGKVQTANGGTLFLDEVGEVPLPLQARLLRLVQERTFFRVGGTARQRADLRFVCATHRNLEEMVAEGLFRQDLYYRLRVVEIEVPPLRRRGLADLDRLVDHFLYEFGRRHRRPGMVLDAGARAALHAHDWPGNVRELQHCIESAVVMADGDKVTADMLPIRPPPKKHNGTSVPEDAFITGVRALREVERDYVKYVLDQCDDNRSQAARVLGIGRNTLLRKLRDA